MMAKEASVSALEDSASAPARAKISVDRDDISLLDVMIVVAQRKSLILKITALAALVSAAVSLVLPKHYTASVLLLPPQQNSSLGAQLASQLGGALGGMAALAGGSGGSLLKNPNDMYVAMLQSRSVEDAMIDRYGLMQEYGKTYRSDARKAWEKHATVDGNNKDGLIHISVWDWNPSRAAELANGYVDQFRKLSENLAITEAGQRRMFFQQQMEHAKNDLANAEVALTQTQEKTGLIQLDSQARALIESAATLRAQIVAKDVQIQAMKTYATGENAQLIEAQQELDGLRAQLARMGGNQDIPGSAILPPKGQMTAAGMEYVRRLRDVKYYETIFDILARQFEIAKLDEAKEGAVIQVLDPAIPPDRRSFPKRMWIVVGGTCGGFLIGIAWALISNALNGIQGDDEQRRKFQALRSALRSRR